MIERSNLAAKPVICTGNMLDSMAESERPDRREAEDVAIAVTDGVDAVLLSDAAANGKNGLEALNTIGRCCAEAERTTDYKGVLTDMKNMTPKSLISDDGLAASSISAVLNMDLELIIVVSLTGDLPRLLSKYRPSVTILTFSPDEITLRQLCMTRAVNALKIDDMPSVDRPQSSKSIRRELMKKTIGIAKELGQVKPNSKVLFMQERGTDASTQQGGVVDASHSYKKIVEVSE